MPGGQCHLYENIGRGVGGRWWDIVCTIKKGKTDINNTIKEIENTKDCHLREIIVRDLNMTLLAIIKRNEQLLNDIKLYDK